jgi:hypothetical protein
MLVDISLETVSVVTISFWKLCNIHLCTIP